MRSPAFVLGLLAVSISAFAARPVTVAQLEQQLAALRGKPDLEAARQIAELQLTERLSVARLAELEQALSGEESRRTLLAVADVSGFLAPPAGEIPARPAPDFAEQRRIMGLTVAYVGKTLPLLPNFLATRTTQRFEDTPLIQKPEGGFVPYEPIHFVDAATADVLYQDRRETVQAADTRVKARETMKEGLVTWGVFGPILSVVLMDAAQSRLGWSRWEQGPDGVEGVFSYAVPKAKSHYEVVYCCVASEAASMVADLHPFRQIEGYHGEIAVDPATGTIRRLTLVADMKAGDPVVKAGILVEYGPVEIGGRTYICPLHSVSSSLAQTVQVDPKYHFPLALQLQPLKNSVSDAVFEKYHVFRVESRVVTEAADGGARDQGTEGPRDQALAGDKGTEGQRDKGATAALGGTEVVGEVATPAAAVEASAPTAAAPETVPAKVEQPENPEITSVATKMMPDIPATPQEPAASTGFTLRTTSRLVDVAVVAFDKKGRPVTDLKADDLEIYDSGVKQKVSFFSQGGAGVELAAAPAQSGSGSDEPVFTNRPAIAAGPASTEANSTILLIDAANVVWDDLGYARAQLLTFLKGVAPGEPVGLYILRSYGFQVLLEPTTDHALVATTLGHWTPDVQDAMHARQEEDRNRQHIDWVAHASDLAYVNGNDGTDPEGSAATLQQAAALNAHGVDPQLKTMGANPERDALFLLQGVARHLAARPGHKSLVWVSSDNVLADWSNQAPAREEKGNRFLDQLAMRSRETLNEAHVSIYPLDASQLESSAITSDLQNRLVGVKIPSPVDTALAPPPPPAPGGRNAAEMHQDEHAIQGTFRDLAAATGGRVFRRSGEIAHEIDSVVADGRAAYQVSFAPDAPADDKYHVLTVKTARPGLTLHYRTGYLYSKEPATMRERFREAVWQARDVNDIGMTATAAWDGKGTGIKLNIAVTDLALAEQGGRMTDKLDIILVLRDDAGLHATVAGQTVGLDLKPATYQRLLREGIPFELPVHARPDADVVRVVVIDENARRIGTVTVPASEMKGREQGAGSRQ